VILWIFDHNANILPQLTVLCPLIDTIIRKETRLQMQTRLFRQTAGNPYVLGEINRCLSRECASINKRLSQNRVSILMILQPLYSPG